MIRYISFLLLIVLGSCKSDVRADDLVQEKTALYDSLENRGIENGTDGETEVVDSNFQDVKTNPSNGMDTEEKARLDNKRQINNPKKVGTKEMDRNLPDSNDPNSENEGLDPKTNKGYPPEDVNSSTLVDMESQPDFVDIEETPALDSKTMDSEDRMTDQPVVSDGLWDDLLKKYVSSSGSVNYSELLKVRSQLEMYLSELRNHTPESSWTSNREMAYWINAYNAFTIDLILNNYPLASITDLDNGNPWEVRRIKLGGQTYSLNDIEHTILRPKFGDARIHFAVNCAARSCPPLLNEAWTEDNIERNLDKMTKSFIDEHPTNQLSPSKIRISKIFQWYAEDFGNLVEFINSYSKIKVKKNAQIEYSDYDWRLNEK